MVGRLSRASVRLGGAIGAGCLAVFAWGAPWREIGRVLADADLPTIAAGVVGLLLTSVARAWRWRTLLAVESVSFRHRLTSILIGFAGNNVLPGRLGEPLRCWVLTRLDRRVGFWQAAGSVVVERVFDVAALLALAAAFAVLAPAYVADGRLLGRLEERLLLGAAALALGAAALLVLARRPRDASAASGWRRSLRAELARLRSRRAVARAALGTALLWTSMLLFDFAMLRAFGFRDLGLVHALGLLVVLSLALALPQAPGGVGVMQLASETTLTALYGVPVAPAKAFAIGLWVCQVGVVVGVGALALWLEGLSLAEMRRVGRSRPPSAAQ